MLRRYYIFLFLCLCATNLLSPKLQAQFYAPTLVGIFEPDLAETSALIYFDSCLWSINDGGNSPQIFQFRPAIFPITNSTKKTAQDYSIKAKAISLSPAINRDWEALAQNETHVFVGDFGNNSGRRRDLTIYILDKAALRKGLPPLVDSIRFRYSDQIDFAPPMQAHNFDCEAFVYADNALHLFTKNWANQRTRQYTLSLKSTANNGEKAATIEPVAIEQIAVFRREFDSRFLVTDATLDQQQRNLLLVGYNGKNGSCEALLFSLDSANNDFLAAPARRINLPHAIQLGQLEGATFTENRRGYFSAEAFGRGKFKTSPQLFSFDFLAFLPKSTHQAITPKTKKKLKIEKRQRCRLRFSRLFFAALVGLIRH